MNFPLWSHQQHAIALGERKLCLFFDTGTGKTRTAIEIKKILETKKGLVIAPINVCRNWRNEILQYIPEEKEQRIAIIAGGNKAKKIAEIQRIANHSHGWLIVNTETIGIEDLRQEILQDHFDFLIVDEAHEFKNPLSKRSIGLFEFLDKQCPEMIYALTGTPTPQNELDLYTPMRLMGYIDRHEHFIVWRKRHFEDVNNSSEASEYLKRLFKYEQKKERTFSDFNGWKSWLIKTIRTKPVSPLKTLWDNLTNEGRCKTPFIEWRMDMVQRITKDYPTFKIRKESKEFFAEFLQTKTLTANKNEVLDLPPYVRTEVFFQLSNEQRAAYTTMYEDFYADVQSERIVASNVLSRLARLQSITAGFISNIALDSARLEALDYALELIGSSDQFLIWTIYDFTYKALSNHLKNLGISHGMLIGATPPEERARLMAEFQAGKIRCLIGHPKAGGVGVNLTAANWSISYTKNFNLVFDQQSEARNYRGGSEIHKRITRIDIMAEDTVDEDVHRSLLNKASVQDLILNFKKKAKHAIA